MAFNIYLWKDGTISITKDGRPYNNWTEQSDEQRRLVIVEEIR